MKPSSAHKLDLAIAEREEREGSNLGRRPPLLCLPSRASKNRDLDARSHAMGFLYRWRTFPILFIPLFFLSRQKISQATWFITPNIVQKEYIANSKKSKGSPRTYVLANFFTKKCMPGGGGQRLFPWQLRTLWVSSGSYETLHSFKILPDQLIYRCVTSLPEKFQTAL